MIFGELPIQECKDCFLAHTLKLPQRTIKKGSIIGDEEFEVIRNANITKIWVAKLEPNDVHENKAASMLATSLENDRCRAEAAFTGRVNLFSTTSGIFCPDSDKINEINCVDSAITLATLESYSPILAGKMVATVKIIPFAVKQQQLQRAISLLDSTNKTLKIVPYKPYKIGVISTQLPSLKESVITKTLKNLEFRLRGTDAAIKWDLRVPHAIDEITKNLEYLYQEQAELIIIFGASAITDCADIIPASIEKSGGEILRFGLPVDPGNLLLYAQNKQTKIIGAPGCARSPKENGFDWILHRTLAGIEIQPTMFTNLGVGGLLMDIMSRPVPRQNKEQNIDNPKVAAIILAAGKSSRMGKTNKLLAKINKVPLVRICVEHILSSDIESVSVVTGHMADEISEVLSDCKVSILKNENFATGLSSSLEVGINALPDDVDAVLIVLADMPFVQPNHINHILKSYDPANGIHIVVPTSNGKRGNPVLWSRRFFNELCQIKGDIGARLIIEANSESVSEVEIGDPVSFDIDTQEQLQTAGGQLNSK